MKKGRIFFISLILAIIFSSPGLLFCQDSMDSVPCLKYVHPDSAVLLFFDWDTLIKKGLSWEAVKNLANSSSPAFEAESSREDLIKKLLDNPSETGIDPLKRGIIFITLTNRNDSRLSGAVVSLNDSMKFNDFIASSLGPSNSGSIKKTNNFNFVEINSGIIGWDDNAVMLLTSEIDGIDLQKEMSALFENENKSNSFYLRPGLKMMLEQPFDLSSWFSLNTFISNRQSYLEDTDTNSMINLMTNLEITMRLEFLNGCVVINIDAVGLNTNGYIGADLFRKKMGPYLFNSLPGKDLIGFLSMAVDMKKLNSAGVIPSKYKKDINNVSPSLGTLDEALSSIGIGMRDITGSLGGDFLLFATDIGGRKSDIELGLAAAVRDKVKLNILMSKLIKSNIIVKDQKSKNVFLINSGKDKKGSVLSGNIYIILKENRIYIVTSALKDYLLSKRISRPAVSPELLKLTYDNQVTGYIDIELLVKKLAESGKGETAFTAALIGNFFKDIRLIMNQINPASANLRLEINLTDNSENSLKVILDRIGNFTGEGGEGE